MGEQPKTPMAKIILPGLSTTLQDLGRVGCEDVGVSTGGACDRVSAILANRLVSNDDNASVLECSLTGPILDFLQATQIAVTGAPSELTIDNQQADYNKTLTIKKGQRVKLAAMRAGMRSYIAVNGGWRGDVFLGSQSTQLAASAGGYGGTILKIGDELSVNEACFKTDGLPILGEGLSPLVASYLAPTKIVRVTPGPEFHKSLNGDEAPDFLGPYIADKAINRMGIRLLRRESCHPINRHFSSIISGPVFPGTVQMPNDGQPILLACDCQAMGGYPRLLQVIQADLPILGQIRPHDEIWFRIVSVSQARAILRARQRQFPGVF